MRTQLNILAVLSLLLFMGGCHVKSKSELLQGEWKLIATYDLESKNPPKPEKPEEDAYALISARKITLIDKKNRKKDDVYLWKIKGDSLYIKEGNNKNAYPIFLRTLTEEKLEVELEVFGKTRLEFKRMKK